MMDQAKSPGWHEAMISENIDPFEINSEEAASYFNSLENLEKIRCTHGPASTLPVENKNTFTSDVSVGKLKKTSKQ